MKLTTRSFFALILLATIALAALLTACGGDDNPVTPRPPAALKIRQSVALATTITWQKMWALSPSEIFVMGERGYVYKGNGLTWSRENSTVAFDRNHTGAWGNSPNDIYFVGSVFDGEADSTFDTINDTLIDTTVVSYDIALLTNYDGLTFADVPISERGGLNDIWGSSDSNIFAIGDNSLALHYDGTQWETIFSGGDRPVRLASIWGSSDSNIYVCGSYGTFLRNDGTDWSIINLKTSIDLWDVYGVSDSSIYIAASGGNIFHYDGTEATRMETPTSNTLFTVWGSSDNDVYAAGAGGAVVRYDGAAWTELERVTDYSHLSILGNGPGDFYLVGQTALHYDGEFNHFDIGQTAPHLNDVWMDDGIRIVVGDTGVILSSSSGNNWSALTSNTTRDLRGVWGEADGNFVYAVGDDQIILQADRMAGYAWTDISPGPGANLNAVGGLDDSTVWAVGDGGAVLSYTGGTWSPVDVGAMVNLNDIQVDPYSQDTLIYIVGDGGQTYIYDGVWQMTATPLAENLHGVTVSSTGMAYAVGDNGALFEYDNGQWTTIGQGRIENFRSVWSPPSTSLLFVCAEDGTVLRYDQSNWLEIESVSITDLNSLYGLNTEDIVIVGDFNTVLKYSR